MDLAKMLAVLEIIAPLAGPDFRIWRQTRTGLLSYPVDSDAARAHLATSIYLQMALRPHIIHVVAYTEAHHAATATDIVASCKMAHRAIENALGCGDITQDERIQTRVEELVHDAKVTLDVLQEIQTTNGGDALTDATALTNAIKTGILDAPQLQNNPYGRGAIATRIDQRGACIAVDIHTGNPLEESARLKSHEYS
jgi:hypothetical protein